MDPIGILLLLIAGFGIIALTVRRTRPRSQEAAGAQLHRAMRQADLRVQFEYQQARRAMNDAAGQSWRNLAG